MPKTNYKTLAALNKAVSACRTCPRLVAWREEVASVKRAAYRDEDYWGKAVPSFGDPKAHLLIAGLAPAAHGANRTGRMFTGDRSGEWLFRALHRAGFANQPTYEYRNDGLKLTGAYITNIVRCAPPANKPLTSERDHCLPYFHQELDLLKNLKTILCLGSFSWQGVLSILASRGQVTKPKLKFGHAATAQVGPYTLIGSYHPSQQNTFTGKLTQPMFDDVFKKAREVIQSL